MSCYWASANIPAANECQSGVALMSSMPGVGAGTRSFSLEGATYKSDQDRPSVRVSAVTPGYFQTFRIHALEGRLLSSADVGGSMPAALKSSIAFLSAAETSLSVMSSAIGVAPCNVLAL